MTGIEELPRAAFTSFAESTKEDWELIMSQRGELEAALPNRILEQLELLRNDYGGFPVDRLEHSVQTATRATNHRVSPSAAARRACPGGCGEPGPHSSAQAS